MSRKPRLPALLARRGTPNQKPCQRGTSGAPAPNPFGLELDTMQEPCQRAQSKNRANPATTPLLHGTRPERWGGPRELRHPDDHRLDRPRVALDTDARIVPSRSHARIVPT